MHQDPSRTATFNTREPSSTLMFREASSAPVVVGKMLEDNASAFESLVARLRSKPPPLVVTYGRGSSDNAATYAKYMIEAMVGIPVASGAPSLASLYKAPVVGRGAMCIAISQSGRSPDLLAGAEAQKKAGNLVVAIVNDEGSPLSSLADIILPLNAGSEQSVAATKTYIASLAAIAMLTALWSRNHRIHEQINRLPELLEDAFELDWSSAIDMLEPASNLFTLGRGWSLGVAQEAALKLKETCGIHAEALSAAEISHGPMAIVEERFPILGFATADQSGDGVCAASMALASRGAHVLVADPIGRCHCGRLVAMRSNPALEPILMIQTFYRMVNELALRRGFDPDRPPHLAKVTRTI